MLFTREVAKSDLAMFSLATFTGDYRSGENVEQVYALGFDVDEGDVPSAETLRALKVAGVFYPSPSSTPSAPRWRLFLWTSRPVSGAEYRTIWALVGGGLGFQVGQAAKDPSRAWYAPREPAEGEFTVHEIAGTPLDVDALLALAPATPQTPVVPMAPAPTPATTDARRDLAVTSLAKVWPPPGGRHLAQNALAGALVRGGWSEKRTVDFLVDVCEAAEPGNGDRAKREATVRDAVRKRDAGEAFTGWTQLETALDPLIVKMARDLIRDRPSEGFLENLGSPKPANDDKPAPNVVPGGAPKKRITRQRFDWSAPVPPTEWIVDGLIAKETVNLFTGAPNSLKTWSALSLGLAVARGEPWLGRFQTRKGTVLVLDFETGTIPTKRRMHHFGPRATDPLEYAWCGGARLYDPEFWGELRVDAPALVIIDSLSRGSPGLDENSPDIALALDLAKQWAEATGGAAIFIHHAGKAEGNAVRGSSAIKGAAEGVFVFAEVKEKDGPIKRTTMTCDRNKSNEGSPPIKLQFEKNKGMSIRDDEPAQDEKLDAFEPMKARIRLVISQAPAGEIRDRGKLRDHVGGNKTKVSEAWTSMLEAGEAVVIGGAFCLDDAAKRWERVKAAFVDQERRGIGGRNMSSVTLKDMASIRTEDISTMVAELLLFRVGGTMLTIHPDQAEAVYANVA